MTQHRVVLFSDLVGSSALFESVGNAAAAAQVLQITQLMAETGQRCGARLCKMLGDGVLMVFEDGLAAVRTAIDIQHHVSQWGGPSQTEHVQIKIGLAAGPLVEVEGDCYGDPVNLAAHLSSMAGGGVIWALREVMDEVPPYIDVRYRSLGTMHIRGHAAPREVLQIEWDDEQSSDLMTVPSNLRRDEHGHVFSAAIELRWLNQTQCFPDDVMPIQIGRAPGVDFLVADPRVSRAHARISFVNGSFVLSDLSTYGTWVRFADQSSEIPLRRGDCVLIGRGELALGAPFGDLLVPNLAFQITRPG